MSRCLRCVPRPVQRLCEGHCLGLMQKSWNQLKQTVLVRELVRELVMVPVLLLVGVLVQKRGQKRGQGREPGPPQMWEQQLRFASDGMRSVSPEGWGWRPWRGWH